MFEKLFKLKANNTTVKTELMAGLATFMAMAYILAVNPNILSETGMDRNGVMIATALGSFIATLCMAFIANLPFALAPGMGLNAFFAYTVVIGMGYTWQMALAAVLLEGVIFILLSLTGVREAIFNCIPLSLKQAISCGIGLFIAFIGLQNAKIVVDGATLVEFHTFSSETFNTVGIGVLLALIGVIITAILLIKGFKGGILYGILITWVLGIICELTGLYVPDNASFFSVLPDFSNGLQLGSISEVAFKFDFSKCLSFEFVIVMLSFLFVDMFDTLGTLIGVSTKANMLDKDGKLPSIKGALLSDAIGTTAGAALGTSTVTTFVESATGVTAGGRTGLTALTTAVLFGLACFLSPIFTAIPSFATAPALIVVGFYMLGSVLKINFDDLSDAIPAYITIITMPFTYSISDGIFFGVIAYVVINLLTGKAKEKKISPIMYVLALLFILSYVFL